MQVYRFHGEPKGGGAGVEAELDIEEMMGISPSLLTEFYTQTQLDFCLGLKNWTTLLLGEQDGPLVHSVSYGIQGNVSHICAPELVASIDNDFAKLAAAGVTIIFASGDSGSGFKPPPPPPLPRCDGGMGGVAYTDHPTSTLNVTAWAHYNYSDFGRLCCQRAFEHNATAWSATYLG